LKEHQNWDVTAGIRHTPVMVAEVLDSLNVARGGRYLDCTVGEGGHAEALLTATDASTTVLGLDLDEQALATASKRLGKFGDRATLIKGSFADLEELAGSRGFEPLQGVLFDLGLSSLQLESPERGFSFSREGPLDMRFDAGQRLLAADVVNRWSQADLEELIRTNGQEWRARSIARAIVRSRPVETTTELATIVARASGPRKRLDPATKTFQALRMTVNTEMENIRTGLEQAVRAVAPEGRVVVVSYHSLEHALVKSYFRQEATDCVCPPQTPQCICDHKASVRLVNRRAQKPTREEIDTNPRSRSAQLRAVERLAMVARE